MPSFQVSQYDIIDVRETVPARCCGSKRPRRTSLDAVVPALAAGRCRPPCASSCTSCPSAPRSTFRCRSSLSSSSTRSNAALQGHAWPVSGRVLVHPSCLRRQIAGATRRRLPPMLISQRPTVDRGIHRSRSFTVRHRAARARFRLHPRQLAASYPAVVHPGCCGDLASGSRACLHEFTHRSWCERGCLRHHPEHQGLGAFV